MQVFGVSELSAGKLARQRWAIISQARLICCCEREKRSTHTSDHGHKSWALLIWLAPQWFDPVGTILSLPHNGDDEKNLVVFALGGFFSADSGLKSEKFCNLGKPEPHYLPQRLKILKFWMEWPQRGLPIEEKIWNNVDFSLWPLVSRLVHSH